MYKNQYDQNGPFGKVRLSCCELSANLLPCDRCYHAGWHQVNHLFHVDRDAHETGSYYIVYTVRGKGMFRLNGELYETEASTIGIMAPWMSHEYWAADGEPWEFYFMHVMGDNCNSIFQYIIDHYGYSVKVSEGAMRLISKKMESLIRMEYIYFKFEIFATQTISDILLEILKDVNEVYDDEIYSANELVNDVISYIYDHYNSSVTLKEMSAKLYVSEEHMIRIFKKEIGMTPYHFLKRFRLKKACELLTYSQKSTKEVAQAVGYSSAGGFIAQFKQEYQTTPVEYRQSHTVYR